MKNNIGVIIEARLNSSRLPNKHLKVILDIPLIVHLFTRLKKVKNISKIILATTDSKRDDKLENLAKKNKISVYRGDEYNVKKRVIEAAKKFKIDIIISITADCPLIDNNLIDYCLQNFLHNKLDYINNLDYPGLPGGMNCQIFYTKTLIKSYKLCIKNKLNLEHPTLFILRNKKLFRTFSLRPNINLFYPNLRYELDTIDDYKEMKQIAVYFNTKKIKFSDITCNELINYSIAK